MPRFKFKITREYTITEGVERWIDAVSLEAAQFLADSLAEDFNMDCPDDLSEDEHGHSESTSFEAEHEEEPTNVQA